MEGTSNPAYYGETDSLTQGAKNSSATQPKNCSLRKKLGCLLMVAAAAFGATSLLKGSENPISQAVILGCPLTPEEVISATHGDCAPPAGTSLDCGFNPDLNSRQVKVALCSKATSEGSLLKVTDGNKDIYIFNSQGALKQSLVMSDDCCADSLKVVNTSGEIFGKKGCAKNTTAARAFAEIFNQEQCAHPCLDESKC